VTVRAVLVDAAILIATPAALLLGTGARLTGSQPVIDCGGIAPAVCDQKLRDYATHFETTPDLVTYFKLEPQVPGGTCADVTIEFITSTFGPSGVGGTCGTTTTEVLTSTFGPLGWAEGVVSISDC
jgi:hypothetical protein